MRPGEPIGKWFIENLSFPIETHFYIHFKRLGLSYSDGVNTYFLGGEENDNPSFMYLLYFVTPKVSLILYLNEYSYS